MKEVNESLDLILKRIGSRYVYWYNLKYKRSGHLFQDRYKSEAIESNPHFTVVLRYIHQNPLKAGLVNSIGEYIWSSYNEYVQRQGTIEHELALDIIGESQFESYMNERNDDTCLEFPEQCIRLTDEELAVRIEENFKIKASMIQSEPKERRNRILAAALRFEGVSTRQLSRVTGISTNIIWRL